MRGVSVKRTVDLAVSKDQWQLYSVRGVDKAVLGLNAGVAEAINSSASRSEAGPKAIKVLEQYSKYGAADTEGYYALNDILDAVYGEE